MEHEVHTAGRHSQFDLVGRKIFQSPRVLPSPIRTERRDRVSKMNIVVTLSSLTVTAHSYFIGSQPYSTYRAARAGRLCGWRAGQEMPTEEGARTNVMRGFYKKKSHQHNRPS